jgi:hypothetical protein
VTDLEALAKLPPDLDPIIPLLEERRACLDRVDLDRVAAIDDQLVRLQPVTGDGVVAVLLLIEEEIACNAVEGDFVPALLANARGYLGKATSRA